MSDRIQQATLTLSSGIARILRLHSSRLLTQGGSSPAAAGSRAARLPCPAPGTVIFTCIRVESLCESGRSRTSSRSALTLYCRMSSSELTRSARSTASVVMAAQAHHSIHTIREQDLDGDVLASCCQPCGTVQRHGCVAAPITRTGTRKRRPMFVVMHPFAATAQSNSMADRRTDSNPSSRPSRHPKPSQTR
jgi:hypothetical protein